MYTKKYMQNQSCDPHGSALFFWKLDPDPDLHLSQTLVALEAQNGAVDGRICSL
jgi:hypothetical protein